MKKLITLIVAAYMITSMSACSAKDKMDDMVTDIAESVTDMLDSVTGDSDTDSDNSHSHAHKSAEELLTRIWDNVDENDRFDIGGGDSQNITMDVPGTFDITNGEELDVTLAFPMSHMDNIDDAASIVHMMNANTFTAAAYHLKNGTSADTFAEDFKETVKNREWAVGFPECFTVIEADGYVITLFGGKDQVETFTESTEKTVSDARVIVTEELS